MAIRLSTHYSKKLGLPGYSSHSFAASLEVELGTVDEVHGEIHRLYEELQSSVDCEIQTIGFVPDGSYGLSNGSKSEDRTVAVQKLPRVSSVAAGSTSQGSNWKCSSKQRGLIGSLIKEKNYLKSAIESLSHERFRKGVTALNKLEASALIDLLFNHPDLFTKKGGK